MDWLTDPRTWITVLAVLGGALPVWGVIGGYRHARSADRDATGKVTTAKHLQREYSEDHAAMLAALPEGESIADADNALRARYQTKYDDAGLDFDTWDSTGITSMTVRAFVWSTTVASIRGDLWKVILGVACGMAADVWGAWL